MLIARPFYGDVLLKIPIVRDDTVSTACTDGRVIRWSQPFFEGLNESQRHYVLMHEVFHTILMHPSRTRGKKPKLWNVATDIVVNNMCDALARDLYKAGEPGIQMARPKSGLFSVIEPAETADNLYGRILADNPHPYGLRIRANYKTYAPQKDKTPVDMPFPDADLIPVELTAEEAEALESAMRNLLKEAGTHMRGMGASCFVPRELQLVLQAKPLDWKTLLRAFLSEAQSDETSYATPERKYLHMGLILPGHSMTDDGELESVWAFVDSSGSISEKEMNDFLTQLYHIVREFHCEMNIAYWDTSVTDVYRRIHREKDVLTAKPKHSGGTDINCVYRWAAENKLRPWVSVILTDGYFGRPDAQLSKALPKRNTILVISNESQNPVYDQVGKVTRLTVTK